MCLESVLYQPTVEYSTRDIFAYIIIKSNLHNQENGKIVSTWMKPIIL